VLVRGLGQTGEVASIDQATGRAEVVVGNFRMAVDITSLERVEGTAAAVEFRPDYQPRVTFSSADRSAPLQLDIRGQRADEALEQLERYLDDAFLAGLPFVRIVHGKGTGALRQVVRDHLAGNPLVDSWAGADQREGGEGATVAKLRTG
jgi:DNA mismatch repair protein MutS2